MHRSAAVTRVSKSDRTRSAILDAAFDFLWSHPFREMTVNEVMSATGLSRPAFYQYFVDLHELMETMLDGLRDEILEGAQPWFQGSGSPVERLDESLSELVRICYRRGPFLRAVADAATADARLEKTWQAFLEGFDAAVSDRIAADQQLGLISAFDPLPVAVAFNRMDAYLFIDAFGRRPRKRPEPVLAAIRHIWFSTLYRDSNRAGKKLARPS